MLWMWRFQRNFGAIRFPLESRKAFADKQPRANVFMSACIEPMRPRARHDWPLLPPCEETANRMMNDIESIVIHSLLSVQKAPACP